MSDVDAASSRTLVVQATEGGSRLDLWLSERLTDQSRARLQGLIAAGEVLVDGAPARSSLRVRPGMVVSVRIPAPTAATPEPEDIPLSIVYEDARLLVVDKPAGLVVHPGAGRHGGTLVNALLHQVRGLSGVGGVLRPGIVHRLDRGTSGLLVVAKGDEAHRALSRQFGKRTVEKEYLALVLGLPRRSEGSITAPIERDPVHRKKMTVRTGRGRDAHTTYEVVEALDGATLLRVRIHTGRTHQIRVHLASLGHPVAGDATYGGRRDPASKRSRSREALRGLERPALHAARLAFDDPATGRRLSFESPLPEELAALVRTLRD
jgi:23S rRNA pseudouridine1911/1915/1917 synthase